jgi:hypothetical protein
MTTQDDCSDVFFAPHIGTNKFHAKKLEINSSHLEKRVEFLGGLRIWPFLCTSFRILQSLNPSVMNSFINHQCFLN